MIVGNNFQNQVQQEARRQLEARAAAGASAREVPAPIVDALRAELKQLVDGDLTKTIGQLIKVAQRASDLFVAIRSQEGTTRHSRALGELGTSDNGIYADGYGVGSTMMVSPGYQNPEQFGARAIRELVSLVPEILSAQKSKDSPADLVTAIAFAKAQGMTDIVEHLRGKLLGTEPPKPEEPKAIAAPPPPTDTTPVILDAAHEPANGTNGTNGVAHVCTDHDVREGGA